jgi:hypothetical protein
LSSDAHGERPQQNANGDLWRPEEEHFYGNQGGGSSASSGRWHYPANFDDAVAPSSGSKRSKKKKEKKDRWARTEDAYSISEQSSRKKSKKKKSKSSLAADSAYSREESTEFPEDAEGGLYGDGPRGERNEAPKPSRTTSDEVFNHEF